MTDDMREDACDSVVIVEDDSVRRTRPIKPFDMWKDYERLRAELSDALEVMAAKNRRIEELEEKHERLDRIAAHVRIRKDKIDAAMQYLDLVCANERINLAECGLRPLMRTLLLRLGIATDRDGCAWRMDNE